MHDKLLELKQDLANHHRNKKDLELYYLQNRLNATLSAYYKDLEYSINYLNNRKEENIFKKLGD